MSLPLPKKAPGRPRCNTVKATIYQATHTLMKEVGLRQMSVEAIAARAKVSKATIYRWWPNKVSLALECFLKAMESTVELPNTGSVKRDMQLQLQAVIAFYGGDAGDLFRQFIAEAQCHPEISRELNERFILPRRNSVRLIWERGIQRGELRPDLDVEMAMDLLYGPMVFRLLTQHAPLSSTLAEQIVDVALYGCLLDQPGLKPPDTSEEGRSGTAP